MDKTLVNRGTFYKADKPSITDTIKDIKQVKTLSKGLTPTLMQSLDRLSLGKIIKDAPDFSRQQGRTNKENLKGKTKTAEGKEIPIDEQDLR